MKKPQIQIIGLVSAAVVTVGILYALPRVVVDNESEESFEQVAASSESASTPADMHGAEMDASTRKRMDELKASLQTEENKERFLTFADSLAVLYTRYGKFDSAAYVLGGAAEKFPAFPQHVAAGEAYYEAYTFALNEQKVQALATETRKFLGMALEEQPKRTDLKTKVAMTYVSSSNPMQGITMLREILEEDPMNEDALYNMGILSMQSGQYRRAAERFEELTNYYPDHLQGQFYLGISYFESNQKNKAKKQFDRVSEMTDDPVILSGIQSYRDRL